jgi:hypothetical protein
MNRGSGHCYLPHRLLDNCGRPPRGFAVAPRRRGERGGLCQPQLSRWCLDNSDECARSFGPLWMPKPSGILTCGTKNGRSVRHSLGRSTSPLEVAAYTYDKLPPWTSKFSRRRTPRRTPRAGRTGQQRSAVRTTIWSSGPHPKRPITEIPSSCARRTMTARGHNRLA